MIYEYKCDECGKVWEEQRPVANRDDKAICPKCSSTNGTRQMSNCSFQLKGSGWERDGYSTYIGDALGMKPHKAGT